MTPTSTSQVFTNGNFWFPTLDHFSEFIGARWNVYVSLGANVFFVCCRISIKSFCFACSGSFRCGPCWSFLPFTQALSALLLNWLWCIFVLSSFWYLMSENRKSKILEKEEQRNLNWSQNEGNTKLINLVVDFSRL